ncbi:rho guanine nucleotide exchange factor 3-like isoform X2 [Ptychodera flava]|uniref:rho guanine nucleotide exchange factor 3-like isoform X2 n=1 Tax=Ptychodera flava TaxID=63121 RepID=UPI003969E477
MQAPVVEITQAPQFSKPRKKMWRSTSKMKTQATDENRDRCYKKPLPTPNLGTRSLRRRGSILRSASTLDIFTRKRKEPDDDNISVCSLDIKEPSSKRGRSMTRVASFANIISPVSHVKKVGQVLQRSMSFRNINSSPNFTIKPYTKPQATPTKRRNSKLWCETVHSDVNQFLSSVDCKRQEAIFELFQGEEDLIEDLKLIKKTYHDSMKSLGILTDHELQTIFGPLESLVPLHEELVENLKRQRQKDGTTENMARVILEWLPRLSGSYVSYCSNQVAAKALLDEKKHDKKVEDFLQRCIESPFSRKLDLWNFLDVPRSRLVKYPLLLKNILQLTSADHEDRQHLIDAVKVSESIVRQVDRKTGEAKCRQYITSFEYLDDKQMDPLINKQKVLLCGGVLRNNKGTKLHVFLFEDILVFTRQAVKNDKKCYQVYRQPIPVRQLMLEDLEDGEVKMGGSFRGAFTQQLAKHMFRIMPTDPTLGQGHVLQANDEHDKKQWMQLLRSVMPAVPKMESVV